MTRKRPSRLTGFAILCTAFLPSAANAQTETPIADIPEVLILLDMSGSMADWIADGRKIDLAAQAIDETVDDLSSQGTRTAVLGFAGGCWEWPPTSLAGLGQVFDLDWHRDRAELWPDGQTPTAVALLAALYRLGVVDDRSNVTGEGFGTIILISDGESNGCEDPCDVAAEYGSAFVTVHAIGFALAQGSGAASELQCIADSTGGISVTVDNFEALSEVISALAELSGGFEFLRVEAVGSWLEVDVGVSSNIPLSEAYLRVVGAADLLGSQELVEQLGRLEQGDEETISYRWQANACDSLQDVVVFTLGGLREEDVAQEAAVENPMRTATVEEILLHGMTDRSLRQRCSHSYTGSGSPLSVLNADSDGRPGTAPLRFFGSTLSLALVAAAASRSSRRKREDDPEDERVVPGLVEDVLDTADKGGAVADSDLDSARKLRELSRNSKRWINAVARWGKVSGWLGTAAYMINEISADPSLETVAETSVGLAAATACAKGASTVLAPIPPAHVAMTVVKISAPVAAGIVCGLGGQQAAESVLPLVVEPVEETVIAVKDGIKDGFQSFRGLLTN